MNNCEGKNCSGAISGIRCDVVNCAYHHEGHQCHADYIEVGNGNCKTSSETACNTFKRKV